MELSEAIRLGATLNPQCADSWVRTGPEGISTCALAAALEAVGANLQQLSVRGGIAEAFESFPVLRDFSDGVSCPACRQPFPLAFLIVHLNDWHRWTRQQIADLVAEIEEGWRERDIREELRQQRLVARQGPRTCRDRRRPGGSQFHPLGA